MRSWKAWYVLYAIMGGFGCLGFFGSHSDSIRESRRWHMELVAKGQPTAARVTQMKTFAMGDDTGYNIFYTYEVAGRRYDRVANPSSSEYARYRVGDSITVTYLPRDPGNSDYRPEDWIKNEDATEFISRVLIIGALVLCVLTGAMDLFRRRVPTATQDLPGETTYFASSAISVIGSVFFVVGLFFQIAGPYQLLSPQTVANTVTAPAGVVEKLVAVLFPIPFWCIGAFLLMISRNFRLVASETGIRVRDAIGRWWEAPWESLKIVSKGEGGFRLGDGRHTVWVQNYIENSSPLLIEVRARLKTD